MSGSDESDRLRVVWLDVLRAAHAARFGQEINHENAERLLDELEAMAGRLIAVSEIGFGSAPRRDGELAVELANADPERVEQLRIEHDLSYAEICALAWTVNPDRVAELLAQIAHHLTV